mmetsp:Transcript_25003/g.69905  ORF Transcript_25003/g.69905 Transcript_25003/m.69905 type:complete len:209 (-) Transcript_25003:651-1277(-)
MAADGVITAAGGDDAFSFLMADVTTVDAGVHVGPSSRQLHGAKSVSNGFGSPGTHACMHLAVWLSFSKHCAPASLQHFVFVQFSLIRVHSLTTQAAVVARLTAAAATPGVRNPSFSQLHGSLFTSCRSGPGLQEALQPEYHSDLRKHCVPFWTQQRLLEQSSPGFEHTDATQVASASHADSGSGGVGGASPGALSPNFWQLQGIGRGS